MHKVITFVFVHLAQPKASLIYLHKNPATRYNIFRQTEKGDIYLLEILLKYLIFSPSCDILFSYKTTVLTKNMRTVFLSQRVGVGVNRQRIVCFPPSEPLFIVQ